jgi:polyisoprenoid-binding protein YceI
VRDGEPQPFVPSGLDAPPPGYGPTPPRPPRPHRRERWLIGTAIFLVVAVLAGPYVYFHFVEGSTPARLQLPAVVPGAQPPAGPLGGLWNATTGSEAGYRVRETLFGQHHTAVGRTSNVSGQMLISGTTVEAAIFQVSVSSIRSDQASRDAQFHGYIMKSYQYHTADFRLTQPIQLGAIPPIGRIITAGATGQLSMRGVTRPISFPLQAERVAGGIDVNAEITVTFSLWHIPNPSFAIAQVGNTGTIEVLLHMVPAAKKS